MSKKILFYLIDAFMQTRYSMVQKLIALFDVLEIYLIKMLILLIEKLVLKV